MIAVTNSTIREALASGESDLALLGVFDFLELNSLPNKVRLVASEKTVLRGVSIRNCSVELLGGLIEAAGGSAGNGPNHYGIRIFGGASDVSIVGCKIRNATKGIVVDGVSNVSVIACDFAMREDGIICNNSQQIRFISNKFHSFQQQAGDHSDAIQIRNNCRSVLIANNTIDDVHQGIGQMDATNDLPCEDIAIVGNRVEVSGFHSITFMRTDGLSVIDNLIRQTRGRKTVLRLKEGSVSVGNVREVVDA
jgi:hypothetical protein